MYISYMYIERAKDCVVECIDVVGRCLVIHIGPGTIQVSRSR